MYSFQTLRAYVTAVAASVALTILYVWGKVEVAELMEDIAGAEAEIASLRDERTRLMAEVVRAKKPGVIVRRAESELRMIPGASAGRRRWR
jgi:cell division protein FtsB